MSRSGGSTSTVRERSVRCRGSWGYTGGRCARRCRARYRRHGRFLNANIRSLRRRLMAVSMASRKTSASFAGVIDVDLVYLAPKVLIIDEMGYLPLDDLGATIFFQLVSARYERGSIILTSNKSYGCTV